MRKASPNKYGEVCEVDMLLTSNLTAYPSENNMSPESYRADTRTGSTYGKNTGAPDVKIPGSGYPKGS